MNIAPFKTVRGPETGDFVKHRSGERLVFLRIGTQVVLVEDQIMYVGYLEAVNVTHKENISTLARTEVRVQPPTEDRMQALEFANLVAQTYVEDDCHMGEHEGVNVSCG